MLARDSPAELWAGAIDVGQLGTPDPCPLHYWKPLKRLENYSKHSKQSKSLQKYSTPTELDYKEFESLSHHIFSISNFVFNQN